MREAISAEKLVKDGKSAYQKGEYLEAARLFEAAQQAYLTLEDPLNGAEMANNVSVAYLHDDKADLALKAVEGTAEIFESAGDLKRQGMALGNLAAVLEALDRTDEAVNMYQRSADILAQAKEDQLRAAVMQSLSMLQFRTGKQLLALSSMQDGLEGIKHPSPKQTFLKKLLRMPIEMTTRKSIR